MTDAIAYSKSYLFGLPAVIADFQLLTLALATFETSSIRPVKLSKVVDVIHSAAILVGAHIGLKMGVTVAMRYVWGILAVEVCKDINGAQNPNAAHAMPNPNERYLAVPEIVNSPVQTSVQERREQLVQRVQVWDP